MGETDYIDDNEDEELPTGAEGDDHDEDGPGEDDEPAAAQADDGEAKPKKTHKERQAERSRDRASGYKAIQAELAEQRRQNAVLQQHIAASVDATRRLAENSQRRQEAPAEPFEARAAKQLAAAAARVRADDPESLTEYHRLHAKLIGEAADERAAARETALEQRLRQEMPQHEAPEAARQRVAASWLFSAPGVYDDAHAAPIWKRALAIGQAGGVDIRSMPADAPTRQKVVDQAIAEYANFQGLSVNMPRRSAANPGAVAGAGARSFAPASGTGAPTAIPEEVRRLADRDPDYKKIKDPAKRYAKYYREMVEPNLT